VAIVPSFDRYALDNKIEFDRRMNEMLGAALSLRPKACLNNRSWGEARSSGSTARLKTDAAPRSIPCGFSSVLG
jgi:hypothetical protein